MWFTGRLLARRCSSPLMVLTLLGMVATELVLPATPASAAVPPIPAKAYRDHTGMTSTTVTVGNVSTLTGGLFLGAQVGVRAYAQYVNSTGGVHGRTIKVDAADDGYNDGAKNQALTKTDIGRDFAMVGGFSLNDSYGASALASNPSVPNVTVSLSKAADDLVNTFSPQPANGGWELGPLTYFKAKYTSDITHAGALIANQPAAIAQWQGEKKAMKRLGYKLAYDPTFNITQTDFTQYVVSMRNAGVKILFVEQMPENYASAVFQAMQAQDFHPVVVLGASTYSNALVAAAGGASATDGAYLEQAASLFLGQDAPAIPAVSTFQSWVQKASPGFKPDLYALYGWASAELFVQALRKAGRNLSRGAELRALRSITRFSAGNLLAPSGPASKTPAECYIIARIERGVFTRVNDTPLHGPNHGYRCDQPYLEANGKTTN